MSNLERPILREDFDNMPTETYAGLGYATHRFADFIPVADDKDQFALRESIKTIGLLDPIVLFEGAILDGRHRFKACSVVGVEPRFVDFEGDEEAALQFVLARNIARRQLSTIQKLTLREKLMPEINRLKAAAQARMEAGTAPSQGGGRVVEAVADMIGVGTTTIKQFDAVKKMAETSEEADGFLQDMLAGNIGVEKAYKQAKAVTFDSDALDREAMQEAAKVDPAKQRAALESAIQKAYDLVINWDPFASRSLGYDARDQIEELWEWFDNARG